MPRLCDGTPSVPSTLASGLCDVCVRSPPADHERTNRTTRKFYLSSNGPRPRPENCTTRCFALPLLHQQIRPTRTGGTAPNLSRQRDNDDGRDSRPTGAEGGGATVLGGGMDSLFYLCFLGASYSLVAQAERCHRARSWVLHIPGRDGRREKLVDEHAAIVYIRLNASMIEQKKT